MFLTLTSRCMMPCEWQCESASSICRMKNLICDTGSDRSLSVISPARSCSRYSNTCSPPTPRQLSASLRFTAERRGNTKATIEMLL
jgi:hypothetical protein